MIAGARVEVAPYKKSPARLRAVEAVARRRAGLGQPVGARPARLAHRVLGHEPSSYLGETIDIHGGGIDLIFPHHENEIAQSCAARGAPGFARYWMHNGFCRSTGEKMSKSLGNFFTIRDLLKIWPGDVLRLQMLKTHYRQPIDWKETSSQLAMNGLDEWSDLLQSVYTFDR